MVFKPCRFSDCNIDDAFFDSLKEDYPEFIQWFGKKASADEYVYVYRDPSEQIQALLYLKENECEAVGELPPEPRIKIGTLKVCSTSEGRRIGEGAIGMALWKWRDSSFNQIYVTVYPKHENIIELLKKYGFVMSGKKGGEDIYMKDKTKLDYSDPAKSFPYINPKFETARYIPIEDAFHDKMFQFSDLKGVLKPDSEMPVSNGITKSFVATPTSKIDFVMGDLVFMYRKCTEKGAIKSYRSAVTSFCTVSHVEIIRQGWKYLKSFQEFKKSVGNKTVYSEDELKNTYEKANVYVIDLLYNGFFGEGNNVNYAGLKDSGLWGDQHPYLFKLSREQAIELLKMGGKDEYDIVINQS